MKRVNTPNYLYQVSNAQSSSLLLRIEVRSEELDRYVRERIS